QQQRVAVARALLHGGELLVADEPVASVDHETAELILGVLRRFAGQDGRAVLVSLHQRPLALQFCTRLVALRRGQIVYDGPPAEAAWLAGAGRPADRASERAAETSTAPSPAALP
ncbi:MAG: phosphonate ABC transporter ATP-binding protein, partial [Chloroflexota bacterium]